MTQTADPASRPRRPLTIVVAAVLLTVEALTALAYAALELGQIRMARAAVGVGVTILMAAFGLLLLLIGRGVFFGRRWSRGPAVATQLILLPLAWSFVGGHTTWVAVMMAAVAITVLVGLLHPRSTAVFVGSSAGKTQT
jgi:predicted transporter